MQRKLLTKKKSQRIRFNLDFSKNINRVKTFTFSSKKMKKIAIFSIMISVFFLTGCEKNQFTADELEQNIDKIGANRFQQVSDQFAPFSE